MSYFMDSREEIFIGIAPQDDVGEYLAGVNHTVLKDVGFDPFRPVYRDVSASATPETLGSQQFWAASVSESGEQELTWNVAAGNWTVVGMNADATPGFSADLQAGFRSELIRPPGAAILIIGLVILVTGLPLLIAGAIGLGRTRELRDQPPIVSPPDQPAGPPNMETVGSAPAPYPVQLVGRFDPGVSRRMWLVKWFLAILHFFLLFFLWVAFAVISIVAWFAILITGRYPRPLFNFAVGVMRWNWRVAFYAYAAAGTDQFLPFTLARTNYPADVTVEYPAHLSRGLVLVRSWLLLIPHLLIVSVITGSATWEWQV
ncbi:DUF4389 domain-containing protein [Arthrobacter sp. TMN-50]